MRFLAERCGFTVLAFEFGFAEAHALDRWLHGHGPDGDLARMTGTANSGLNSQMARWLRRHNTTSSHPLHLVGLDTPVAGGTLRPVLEPLVDYLSEVDPGVVNLAQRALAIDDRIAGVSVAAAAPRWADLPAADQAMLTTALARLSVRISPRVVPRPSAGAGVRRRRHLNGPAPTGQP